MSDKLLLFDFACSACNHAFEELVYSEICSLPCPKCAAPAKRQIPTPRIDKTGMALLEGATPTSIDHFDRIHRERKAIEERKERDHGDYGVAPGSDGGGQSYAPLDLSRAQVVSSKSP